MHSKQAKGLIYAGSFSEGISPILFAVQILGIFPLKGIRSKPSSNVHFSWFSFSSLICLGFLICDLTLVWTNVLYEYSRKTKLMDILAAVVFYSTSWFSYLFFLRLAMRWDEIIKWWTQKEQPFLQSPYVNKTSKKFKSKLLTIAITLAFLSVGMSCLDLYLWKHLSKDSLLICVPGEHCLYQASSINTYIELYTNCNISNVGFENFMERRFQAVHMFMPGIVPMIIGQFISWFATAAWNFLDVFVILICVAINLRFQQFNSALEHHFKYETPTSKSMLKFRLDFIAICELLEYIDKHMGWIVFLSVASNLNFICTQLLNSLNILRFLSDYLYFWLSLVYLILKTMYLFLSAAAINESSRGTIRLLHNIPQAYWNQECNRLLFQINSSNIALSAMGFFNLTRGLILTMAGAIVTFELVMLQFSTPISKLTPLCDLRS